MKRSEFLKLSGLSLIVIYLATSDNKFRVLKIKQLRNLCYEFISIVIDFIYYYSAQKNKK